MENRIYVVKLFEQTYLHQSKASNKEFYANALANAFDLKTPTSALIHLKQETIGELRKKPVYANFNLSQGYYYGCRYVEGVVSYQSGYQLEPWEMANVFAFDALIQNIDRQMPNPNVIIKKRDLFVIDHERALNITKNCVSYLKAGKPGFLSRFDKDTGVLKGHVFLHELKALYPEYTDLFHEFITNLRRLNPRRLLEPIGQQLQNYGNDATEVYDIIDYLNCIKEHATIFSNLLKKLLL